MPLEIDIAAHLIKAEKQWAEVYPAICDGKDAKAILAMLEHTRETLNAVEWLIQKHSRPK